MKALNSNGEPLFRCSRLADLKKDPKLKKDKLAGNLAETAKTFCKDIWLKNTYGFEEVVTSKYFRKGHDLEAESRKMIRNVLGGEYRKRNTEYRSNEFFHGTADIILSKEDVIEDIKNPFTLKTFMSAELSVGYYWQGQGYMKLWSKSNYRLIYTLNPTPEEEIENELQRLIYIYKDANEDYHRHCEQIIHNNDVIKNIPEKDRVKVFEFGYDEEGVKDLEERIIKAREFYKTIKL